MKIRANLSRIQAALFVAAVLVTMLGLPPKAKAGPGSFAVQGCPLLGTRTLAGTIFGPYEWSAGGGRDFPPGKAMMGLLPAGAYITECGFVRKWDAAENAATPDSDILLSGYGQVSDSADLLETWNRLISKFGLTTSRKGRLHFAEKPGLAFGYRDGLNTIAFAYWMTNMHGDLQNVPAPRLRPFITTVVCAGKMC